MQQIATALWYGYAVKRKWEEIAAQPTNQLQLNLLTGNVDETRVNRFPMKIRSANVPNNILQKLLQEARSIMSS